MIGLKNGIVELCEHENEWELLAAAKIAELKCAFGNTAKDIQHIGSTSIRGIKAKPIIDIAVAVDEFSDAEPYISILDGMGCKLRHLPDNLNNDILFACGDFENDIKTYHIHVVPLKSTEWHDYINFRDYMNAFPDKACEYEALKLNLLSRFHSNRKSYTEGKAEFIKNILKMAAEWADNAGHAENSAIETASKTSLASIPNVIHILGGSGSGTTTLGHAISERFGHTHLDTDDFFWEPTNPPFTTKRDTSERIRLMDEAIANSEKCVISGSLCGWGDVFIPKFELVIVVDTPSEIRLERLRKREYAKFGERIKEGGDMYKQHTDFIEWAGRYETAGTEQRSIASHNEWLKGIICPIAKINGVLPLDCMLDEIFQKH